MYCTYAQFIRFSITCESMELKWQKIYILQVCIYNIPDTKSCWIISTFEIIAGNKKRFLPGSLCELIMECYDSRLLMIEDSLCHIKL